MKQIRSSNIVDISNNPSLLLEQAPIDTVDQENIQRDDEEVEFLSTADSIITVKDPTSTITTTPVLDTPSSLVVVQQITSLGEDGVTYVDVEFDIADVKGATDYELRLIKL